MTRSSTSLLRDNGRQGAKRNDIGSPSFHLECEETACWTNLKEAFAGKFVMPKIFVYFAGKIPLPVNDAVARSFNSVVEFAILKSYLPRRRKYLFCHADLPGAPPIVSSH